MTANQMAQMFLIELDTRQAGDTMGYEDDEISLFLNDAVYTLVKASIRQGLETTEYNDKFIAGIKRNDVQNAPLAVTNELHPNGAFWQFPLDAWITMKEYVSAENLNLPCQNKTSVVAVKPIDEDYYLNNRSNKNRKPYFDGLNGLVWRLSYNIAELPTFPPVGFVNPKRVELITDGSFTINTYHVRYLVKPQEIIVNNVIPADQQNSDIYPEFHKDIVFKAVELALENSKNSRFQSRKILNREQSL